MIVLVHERNTDSQSYIIEKGMSGSLDICSPVSGDNTPEKDSLNKWECSGTAMTELKISGGNWNK